MLPGIGSLIRYHADTPYSFDATAVAICTHDTWVEAMDCSQPSTNQVAFVIISPPVLVSGTVGFATEGTSAGQFSLLTVALAAEDV